MGPWLLVVLWVVFVLCATSAAVAAAAGSAPRSARRALAWGVGGALLAATAVPLAQALWLRHEGGVLQVPVGLDLAVAAAHVLGLIAILSAARRGTLPGSAANWTVSAALALALTLLVGQQLELQARLAAADLRFEAGRTAWRLLESRPAPERDAWPVYRSLDDAWFTDDAAKERMAALREDRERLERGEELDFDDPERRERLAWLADDLARVREAAQLEGCDFGARHAPLSAASPEGFGEGTLIALRIAEALHVEACARLDSGDADGALDDLEALGGLTRHALGSPLVVDLMLGSVMAEQALELCARLLGQADLDAGQRARIETALPRDLYAAAQRAFEMEEAWVLSSLSRVASGTSGLVGPDLTLSRLESALYLIFQFEDDVRGYRTSMAELQELLRTDLGALLAEAAVDQDSLRQRYASRGTVAVLAMGLFAPRLVHLRRVDTRLELAREALAAFGTERDAALAQGTWTAADPAWGDDPPTFELR